MNTQTIIITLLVPAITGLAFIAYKHPFGFRKIAFGIAIGISCVLLGLVLYNYGSMVASIDYLYDHLNSSSNDKSNEFSIISLYQSKRIINTAFGIYVLSLVYLAFLYFLPNILGIPVRKTNTSKNQQTK